MPSQNDLNKYLNKVKDGSADRYERGHIEAAAKQAGAFGGQARRALGES